MCGAESVKTTVAREFKTIAKGERELLVHAADTAALKSRVQSLEATSFMAIKALNATAKYVQGIHSITILIA